tara:strand:- start:165 stop:416 length:252 start_codon:yes stop_codon:yes gene_type:complete
VIFYSACSLLQIGGIRFAHSFDFDDQGSVDGLNKTIPDGISQFVECAIILYENVVVVETSDGRVYARTADRVSIFKRSRRTAL